MAERSLMAYAFGLQAFILIKVLAPGFYARQDTRSPVRIAVIAMLANMLLNLILIVPLRHAGLALATSLAAYLNALLLWRGLRRDGVYRPEPGWLRLLLKVGAAAAAMGALLVWGTPELAEWIAAARWDRVIWLAAAILFGAVVYFAVLTAAGMRPRDLYGHGPGEAD
jgi:putative peptidoglycan lipid II flippase